MKKVYVKPTFEVYQIKPCNHLLSNSGVSVASDDYSTGTIMSRDGFGGDEEE